MKVYIAAAFADKDRVKSRCEELNALGIGTTSRWASEDAPHNHKITDKPEQYMQETAVFDLEDIMAADVLVLTTPTDEEMVNMSAHQLGRGGRHFESGLVYGIMLAESKMFGGRESKQLVLLGRKENVFHFLSGAGVTSTYPAIKHIETWDEVKEYLVSISKES
jgi:hypothetical protein